MGLKGKLSLAVLLVVVAVFGAAGWLTLTQIEGQLVQGVRAKGRALLSSMAPPCAIAMANGEFEVVDIYIGQVSASRWAKELDLQYLMLLDHRGKVYAHSDPTRFGQKPTAAFYHHAMRSNKLIFQKLHRPLQAPLVEAAVPVTSGVRWGTLVAAFALDEESALLMQARWRVLFWALGLAAAAGLVLTLLLSFSVLAPLRRLSEATRAFARGQLDVRVGSRGHDELARLGERFDLMADQLSTTTRDLEATVAERTAQVSEQNSKLVDLNAKLAEAVEKLEELAVTDELTGLFNRRKFQEVIYFEIQRNARRPHPFSVMMIDVDHFKAYNDTNGHPAGDAILKSLAELFDERLRSVDLVARYGGEEFVVLLLDTDLAGAQVAAEKIRREVAQAPFPNQHQQPGGNLTVSVGVASYPAHGLTASAVVEAADQALYRAKAAGRNRVMLAGPGDELIG